MLTLYDDLVESIAEVHLSIASENIFSKMRSLSEDDLFVITWYTLVQSHIVYLKWGGDKIYY
jgi:photosystem II cytochrome c550